MTSSKRLINPRNCSFLLLATLSLCPPVLAKKGGKGGGGDGGGGGGENPVPPIVTAPISYAETHLTWENTADVADPGFQGIWVAGVTSRGIAAGNIKRPPLSDDIPSDDVAAERIGSINAALVPGTDTLARDASGQLIATDTMVDLNGVFAAALASLNTTRKVDAPTEKDWRIAYGRRINEAGHLACQLIPFDEARRFANGDPDPVPSLLVVANLNDGSLTQVNPANTSPDQDFLELNAHGDVLVSDREATGWTTRLYILNPATGPGDEASYTEAGLPDSVTRPSFNSKLDVSYSTEDTENGRFVVDRLFRTVDGNPELIWERRGKDYDLSLIHI